MKTFSRIASLKYCQVALVSLPLGAVATSCLAPGELEDESAFPARPDPSQGAGNGAGGGVASSGGGAANSPSIGADAAAAEGCFEACAMLTQTCAGLGCHAAQSPAAGLDLESSDLVERLSELTASTPACSGEAMLVPGAPEQSLVYTKLLDPPSCGLRMPLGDPLTADQLECMRRWVESPSCDPGASGAGGRPSSSGDGGSSEGSGGSAMGSGGNSSMGDGGRSPMGDGGSPPEDAAVDPPLDPDDWTVSASSEAGDPAVNAIDGDLATRWSTGAFQMGGEYFQIDFGSEQSVSRLVLDATGSANDVPVGYEVYASNDPNDFGDPIVSGAGDVVTTIDITGTRARYVRIVQTGTNDEYWWSIHELTAER